MRLPIVLPEIGDILEQTKDSHDNWKQGGQHRVTSITDRLVYFVCIKEVPGGRRVGTTGNAMRSGVWRWLKPVCLEYIGEPLFD